jgi:lysophospholipase L1-like esterase
VIPRGTDAELQSGRYEIAFLAQPRGGKFGVHVDGEQIAVVDTRAESPGPGFHTFELPAGHHAIEVRPRGNGEVRLFGITIEREDPGVVVDTLGIAGTRAANMLRWNEEVWSAAVRRRNPDLWVMFYGTNEAMDTDQPIDAYRADLVAVIERFRRAAPDASCLLMGPGDFPIEIEEGVYVPRPRLLQIVEVQRSVAAEKGCGFWSAIEFMGGPGSMHTWVSSSPRMASADHIHFTKRGYVRIGMALTDALMVDFDGGP